MKYYFLLAILFVSVFLTQYVTAIPYQSPEDLYKQSYIVLYGKVIAKDSSGSNHYDYQIRAEQYFKNLQTSDSITVIGQKMDNETHLTYPQFEVGDMAIFYVDKVQGTYVISPYSTKAGDACDIHAFLGPKPILGEPVMRGQPNPLILTDENGGRVGMIPVGHPVIIKYALANNYPSSRNYTMDISVQKENDTAIVFHKTQTIEVDACGYSEDALKWNFVPMQSGNFTVNAILDGNLTASASLEVNKTNLSVDTNSVSTSSPLKQFKSGIVAKDVKCEDNLQLVIKAEDGSPACVKSDTAQTLIQRGWTKEIIPQMETHPIDQPLRQVITPCQTLFEKNTNFIQVLYMPLNSSGMICIQYSNLSQNSVPVGIQILESTNLAQHASQVVISANATSIMPGNSTVVYTIKTGSQAGFYQFSVFCSGMPFAVGYNNQSSIVPDDFPWLHQSVYCPLSPYNFKVIGLSNIGVTNLK